MKVFKKVKCDICGRELTICNLSKHLRRHEEHPETFVEAIYKLTHEGLSCQFCGKECKNKNSLCNHERLCKQNPNFQSSEIIKEGFNNKGRSAWNKGLHTPDKVKEKISKALSSRNPKVYTEEEKRRMVEKGFQTKKRNGTLNSSKSEEVIYNKLMLLFGSTNVYRHYKDKRYPYECDFYIKSKDLFIEINFHWTHGSMPFNENDVSCLDILSVWNKKAETSKYFQNAVDVWTRRDKLKLNTAKINNLNYIVIYNTKELNNFFNSLVSG